MYVPLNGFYYFPSLLTTPQVLPSLSKFKYHPDFQLLLDSSHTHTYTHQYWAALDWASASWPWCSPSPGSDRGRHSPTARTPALGGGGGRSRSLWPTCLWHGKPCYSHDEDCRQQQWTHCQVWATCRWEENSKNISIDSRKSGILVKVEHNTATTTIHLFRHKIS